MSQSDRIEAAAERRRSLEEESAAILSAELKEWSKKDEKAEEQKMVFVEEKRAKAHASLEDVEAGHARAQIHDAIRDSTIRLEYHEHELQAALAQERKSVQIDLIKAKQAHLQGTKHASSETIVADDE
ncbi:UNVERIFIED_CONTAM: hypothetical protein HDU68_003590 [Siphonaria sp. JEL0065]|nr:hypothetical protein HDU68_003590 [Siphonaria sp. JEL0065]